MNWPRYLPTCTWRDFLRLLATLTICLPCVFTFAAASEHSSPEKNSEDLLSEDNLLIVDIVLGSYRLASDVFIYSSPEATVIPLQPLFDAVEFPIAVDPVALKAHGWLLRESNRFDLNISQRQMVIGRKVHTIPDSTLILADDYDIYVDILALKKWFPFRVELQTSRLRLNVISDEPLPIERQLERERKRKKSLPGSPESNVPVVADNYRTLGIPVFDVNLGATLRDIESQAGASGSGTESDTAYSVQASADILGLQGSLSVSRASTNVDANERFTLYKRPNDLDRNMPGQLGYAAVGDIFSVSNALILNGGEGLGADFQFGGVRRASDFGKRSIEGEATPGWEVELYRNGSLVDFQLVGEGGRYRFEDIAVEYGENVFDIRLFGPQGQELSRREAIRVGEQAMPRGEFYGRASYVNLDESVFDNDSGSMTPEQGLGKEQQAYLFLQAGLTDWLSSSVGYTEHRNGLGGEDDNEYIEFGLTGALPFAAVGLQHASQTGAGDANLMSIQTRLGDTSLSYLHKRFNNFESNRNPDARLQDDAELRLTGALAPFAWNPLAYQLIAGFEQNVDGTNNRSFETRLGFQFLNGRMTLDTELNEGSFSDRQIRGRARYLRVVGAKTSLRAALDYNVDPGAEVTGASTSITWRPQQRLRTQLSLNGDFTGNNNNNLGLAVSYLFDEVTLSANTLVQEGGGSSLLLNAEFSLGRENNNRWRFSSQPQAAFGRLRSRIFLDHDQSGDFSGGDEPLPGVRFEGRKEWEDKLTDESGIVFLRGLRTEFPSIVELDQGSLEDPYWRSAYTKKAFVSHAGGMHTLEIPVVVTAEVEGSVLILKKGQVSPLAGIPVYVVDAAGERVARAITEFDGFFVLENIVPSKYWLELDKQALEKFAIGEFAAIPFSVTAEQGVVYLESIILEPGAATGLEKSIPNESTESPNEKPVERDPKTSEREKALQGPANGNTGGKLFRIQVAAYRGLLPARYKNIHDLEAIPGNDGLTRYVTQAYSSYMQAEYRQRALADAGFDGAFIYVGNKASPAKGHASHASAPMENEELSATEEKEPSAAENEEPAAVENEELLATEDKEPSAVENKKPSAVENKEPSAVENKEPSAVEENEPPEGDLRVQPLQPAAFEAMETGGRGPVQSDSLLSVFALFLVALLVAVVAVLVLLYRYLASQRSS